MLIVCGLQRDDAKCGDRPFDKAQVWLGPWTVHGEIARRHPVPEAHTPSPKSRTARVLQPTERFLATHILYQRYSTCYPTSCPYLTMWDDEDNNPYGSFARHDSNTSDVTGLASPAACKASIIGAEAGPGL